MLVTRPPMKNSRSVSSNRLRDVSSAAAGGAAAGCAGVCAGGGVRRLGQRPLRRGGGASEKDQRNEREASHVRVSRYRMKNWPDGWFEPWMFEWQFTHDRPNIRLLLLVVIWSLS